MAGKFDRDGERAPHYPAILQVLPLAAPVLLWLIQSYVIPVTFLLPLTLVVILCYLALRLKPITVVFWTIVYMSFVILLARFAAEPPPLDPVYRAFVRAGFVLAGGFTAFFLSSHRVRMEKSNEGLFKVISVLPSPVTVSDVSGNILLMNDACRKLLSEDGGKFTGVSFFSAFTSPKSQGREIEKYVSYFDKKESGPFLVTLHTRGEKPMILDVAITMVTLDKVRYAVTSVNRVTHGFGAQSPKALKETAA